MYLLSTKGTFRRFSKILRSLSFAAPTNGFRNSSSSPLFKALVRPLSNVSISSELKICCFSPPSWAPGSEPPPTALYRASPPTPKTATAASTSSPMTARFSPCLRGSCQAVAAVADTTLVAEPVPHKGRRFPALLVASNRTWLPLMRSDEGHDAVRPHVSEARVTHPGLNGRCVQAHGAAPALPDLPSPYVQATPYDLGQRSAYWLLWGSRAETVLRSGKGAVRRSTPLRGAWRNLRMLGTG